MGRDGFEPSKSWTTDLQSVPFGRSGIFPCYFADVPHKKNGAGERNRTINLLITNQLLCLIELHQHNYSVPMIGASGRNRTTDTGIFSPLLYLLSYRSKTLATRKGLEPSTSSVTGWRTNHLYYRAKFILFCVWWAFRDLNPGPIGYEPTALTTELKAHILFLWSGWRDSNSRHLAPKASALPNCATPRCINISLSILQYFANLVNKFIKLFQKKYQKLTNSFKGNNLALFWFSNVNFAPLQHTRKIKNL